MKELGYLLPEIEWNISVLAKEITYFFVWLKSLGGAQFDSSSFSRISLFCHCCFRHNAKIHIIHLNFS